MSPLVAPPAQATTVDPSVPVPQVAGPEARHAAYQQLLSNAAGRSDRGDSSQAMADILNRVDMGRADRIGAMYDTRRSAYASAGDQLLAALAAARQAKLGGTGSTRRLAPTPAYTPWPVDVAPYLSARSGGASTRLTYR